MSNAPDSGLVIGVGHAERQDDGVGPYVARALMERGLPAVVHEGEGSGLLDLWEFRPACIVVDAVSGGEAPGHLRVFTDLDHPAFQRAGFVHSTHRLGLPEAVALGRALGRMPERLLVIGVAGTAFGFGGTLSTQVAAAADRLIEALARAEDPFSEQTLAGLSRS